MRPGIASFASDNHSGAHPDVLAAVVEANAGHQPSYGGDPLTEQALELIRRQFGEQADVLLALTGTGANVVGLQTMLRPYEAVLCATSAHIATDECGAPEHYLGSKLIGVPTPDGKLTPELVEPFARGVGDQQAVQPRVVAVTQSTELGTLYQLDELRRLADWAHARNMLVHLDGARLFNAAAALGVELSAFAEVGVDVLSFGATKNGALGAEAVVVLNPALAVGTRYIRKQAMQLPSKMRFVAAQWVALLADGLWRRNAAHANAMAARLAAGVDGLPAVRITRPVEVNAVFAELPPRMIAELQEQYAFYVWDEQTCEVRWMTSFDTTPDDVDDFVAAVRRAAASNAR
ncbi:MAG: threonine aldolase [Frankiaceae bacterium]|nr:threonine aldolase [Frankiaceae bacterium]